MNGFAGVFSAQRFGDDELQGLVRRLARGVTRGRSGDWASWSDRRGGVAVVGGVGCGPAIREEPSSSSSTFSVALNGEIYNRREVLAELGRLGQKREPDNDSILIRYALEEWGLEPTLARLNGAFVLAVWDRHKMSLTLARDRLGLRRIYLMRAGGNVSFATRLSTLHSTPGFERRVDPDSLALYLRHLYVPAPRTILRGVHELEPGKFITIADPASPLPEPRPYWSLIEYARRGLGEPRNGTPIEIVDKLEEILSESVRLRLDGMEHPGALLSGGIDSSLIVALMAEHSRGPVRTYAVSFDATEHDESAYAAEVARHLGTEHSELRVSGGDALTIVPELPEIFDEPMADVSQIPAYLICAAARHETEVVFAGDGGDELFGGYNRYLFGERMLRRLAKVPFPLRRLTAVGLSKLSVSTLETLYEPFMQLTPGRFRQRLAGQKIAKISRLLSQESVPAMYRSLISAWQDPSSLVVGERVSQCRDDEGLLDLDHSSRLIDRMLLTDQLGYLPGDQLAKLAGISRATSMSLQTPLLDHRVVEYSWRVPTEMKVAGGQGKMVLRELLYRRLPPEMIDRPKMGLSVPLDEWLRGPLRPWAEDLLAPAALEQDDLLRVEPIRATWRRLLNGSGGNELEVWSILVFQAWRKHWQI